MGLLDGLLGEQGSDQRLKLKMGLMGMTHRPNAALMNMWGGELQQSQATKAEAAKVNKTAQYLRSLGTAQAMQAAAALESGAVDANTAYQTAMQQAEPVKGVVVNGAIRNPITGEAIYEPPPKPDNTNATVAWLQQQGRDDLAQAVTTGVMPALDAVKEATDRQTPLVQIGGEDGNSSAFIKKADESAAARFDQYQVDGANANQLIGDINALAALAPQVGTGKGAEIMQAIGPYAEAFGVDIQGLDEGQAYKAIIDRMAPAMRPVGSGSSSDFDAKQFLSSLPSLGRSPEGNQIIMDTLRAIQDQKIAAANLAARAYLRPDDPNALTWQDAEAQIRKLGNPYDGFNAYKKRAPKDAEAKGDAPAPKAGRIRYDADGNVIQ